MSPSQLLLCLALLALLCAPSVYAGAKKPAAIQVKSPFKNVGLDLCPTCVQFMSDALQELLEVILNGGVIGSCSKLCSYLNSSSIEEDACNLLCDVVGVDTFIKIIDSVDPDPIFICESLKVCPTSSTGNATVTAIEVSPASGPIGTEFKIMVEYEILSNIGTGQWVLEVNPIGLGSAQILYSPKNGTYSIGAKVTTKPNKNNNWQPGQYQVAFAVCEGTCGSKHAGSAIVAEAFGNFTITA